jgi:hypothetical protein
MRRRALSRKSQSTVAMWRPQRTTRTSAAASPPPTASRYLISTSAARANPVRCEPTGRVRQRSKLTSVDNSVNLFVPLVRAHSEQNAPSLGFTKRESEWLRRVARFEPLPMLEGARYPKPPAASSGRKCPFSRAGWHLGCVSAGLLCVGRESSASKQSHASRTDRLVGAGGGWRHSLRAS